MGHSQRLSAGTSILVDRSLAPQITSNGIFLEGRVQFITLEFPNNGNLTVVNIYVARTSNKRALMWKQLSEANFDTARIIVRDDFNHLEETDQRGKARERLMRRREVASWHHMTFLYSLADALKLDNFRKMSKKEYTFNNSKAEAHSTVLHINKFLISQELDTRGGRIEVVTSVRKLSDHSPLMIIIWGQPTNLLKQKRYFNSSLLGDEKCKVAML
jgi:endonuclease/exonuclease/phosphatase family metal-dependent hydrolase